MEANYKKFSTILAGRELTVEVGRLAQFANGSVLVRYQDTVILATATASDKPRLGIDFFPLSVDYEERLYSVGKIPGGFIKREGKPSENSVLVSRAVDRSIRPLFPKDMRNDVAISIAVLSVDQDNLPEVAAMIGASIALSISDIPFNGPIGGVILGFVDDQIVINPSSAQRAKSEMAVTLAGTRDKITMIEAGADEVPENIMLDAIKKGHEEIKKIVEFVEKIVASEGKTKFNYASTSVPQEMLDEVSAYVLDDVKQAILGTDKVTRDNNMAKLTEATMERFAEIYPDTPQLIAEALYQVQKKVVREYIIVEKKRPDGRRLDEIRPLAATVAVLPRTHGSAIFERGQTQVLTIATLGALREVQMLDGITSDETKRYMHHYNFPSFSVGETRPSRGPGRREIGHGALAERALEPVIPSVEEFPYALRLVSEVTMSNGSTSQASVCASTLALMDAGVPIKTPVAGISVGLVTDSYDAENYEMLIDIQGIEDFFGDMDFKVAGSKKGITAIQVDIKIDGLTFDMIARAFEIARAGRVKIIDEVILKTISVPRSETSEYAPKIYTINISPDKIRDVIGPGGKVINKIISDTGVKIDIEEDGRVFVLSMNADAAKKAISIIEGLGKEIECGQIYMGKVTRIMPFGAFVEFLPGKEGLVHISKLAGRRVEKVEDVVRVGDEILVKVIEIDRMGKISLSKKDAEQQCIS